MVKCSLRDIAATGTEIRKGRYHGSNFWDLDGFARDRWVVGAYIDFEYEDQLAQSPPWVSEEDIVKECVEFLNQPPERQKYEKKHSAPLYGNLDVYQYTFKRDDHGRDYIEVLLTTDQPKNKYFWGKGKSDKF
jgi:hypothetical protein